MVCLSVALHAFPHYALRHSLNKQLMCSQFFIPPPFSLSHQGFGITTPAVSSFQLTLMLNKHYKAVS